MTILIFGASGPIGDAAAASVVVAGQAGSLRLTTHRAEGVGGLRALYPGAEVVVADYLDPGSLGAAFAGIDRINGDYDRHARRAKEIAHEHFDAALVLSRLVEEACG